MEASFFKRLLAYLIDTFILTIVVSLISTVVIPTKNYEKYSEEYEKITQEYQEKEMTLEVYKEYLATSSKSLYNMNKSSVLTTALQVVMSIGYFIFFQYKMKGQTIGKKIVKIKVVENNTNPSLKAMILRTVIVDSILSGILGILIIYILNKDNYYLGYLLISSVELIFAFSSALFILYRKDKQGLHDMMANTKVIEE